MQTDYSLKHLTTHFIPDPLSESGLAWKSDVYGGRNNKQIIRSAGTRAGGVDVSVRQGRYKVWRVTHNGKRYQVARVVYILHFGDIPSSSVIDHIDGDGLNNKVSNLSLKTPRENNQNVRLGTKNKTGVAGVFLERDSKSKKDKAYTAVWSDLNCKQQRKRFYLKDFDFNYSETLKVATLFRENKIIELTEQGMLYTVRHGK